MPEFLSQKAESLTFVQRHPILKQAFDDAVHLTWQQIGVPALAALGNLFITILNDYSANRLDLSSSLKTLFFSLLIGVTLYVFVAMVRAPFIVIGQQDQQLRDLQARVSEVETRPAKMIELSSQAIRDAAEPNIALHIDGGLIEVHTGSIGIGEGHSVFDLRAIVLRCKNERETRPPRRVGGIANVSGEITFKGYGERSFYLPAELCVWLSDSNERVNFPVGVTQRLVVATVDDKKKLSILQKRSSRGGPQISSTELSADLGDHFRVRIALFAESERTPLVSGDYILERDGLLFGGDKSVAGPQIIPTRIWRSSQSLRSWTQAHTFWELDRDGSSSQEFADDYENWQSRTARFIEQHYGVEERKCFLFEPYENTNPNALRLGRLKPPIFRDQLDLQMKQLARLEKTAGL